MERKTVKVFLDSNVIVSGLFSDRGAPRVILDLVSLGLPALTAMTGEYNIIEVERTLSRKMPDLLRMYREYLPLLGLEIIAMPSPAAVKKLSGITAAKDLPVLASAVSGNADFLVTGDKKDFAGLKGDFQLRITSPAEFLDLILPELMKTL